MNSKNVRIILINRRTRLEELIARHNTPEQARFFVERLGGDFEDYVREDIAYKTVLDQAETDLKSWGRVQRLERGFLPNYIFGPDDLVVVIGQDGLVANTMKYLNGQPVIAINPDPVRYEGVLLPFVPQDLIPILRESLVRQRSMMSITMAEARLNDGQSLLAVNDFFIGPRRHTTAAYALIHGDRREFQMSSGVIVSTGLGSTGWIRSIVLGAARIAEAAGTAFSQESLFSDMGWDSRQLLFAVREPYPGAASQTELVLGRVTDAAPLALESAMAEEGVIFSDGMLDDAIPFNAGARVDISNAARQGHLVV